PRSCHGGAVDTHHAAHGESGVVALAARRPRASGGTRQHTVRARLSRRRGRLRTHAARCRGAAAGSSRPGDTLRAYARARGLHAGCERGRYLAPHLPQYPSAGEIRVSTESHRTLSHQSRIRGPAARRRLARRLRAVRFRRVRRHLLSRSICPRPGTAAHPGRATTGAPCQSAGAGAVNFDCRLDGLPIDERMHLPIAVLPFANVPTAGSEPFCNSEILKSDNANILSAGQSWLNCQQCPTAPFLVQGTSLVDRSLQHRLSIRPKITSSRTWMAEGAAIPAPPATEW